MMMNQRISKKLGLEKQIRIHYLGKELRDNKASIIS